MPIVSLIAAKAMLHQDLCRLAVFLLAGAALYPIEGLAPWARRLPFCKQRGARVSFRDFDPSNETTTHVYFMEIALLEAKKAERRGEVPIGAIVVQEDGFGGHVILSKAHNLVEHHCDASSHAELLAMRQAAKKSENWRLLNSTLYTTLEPCPMCLSAAQAFRMSKIVYGAPDLRLGAVETYIRLLDVKHPIHEIKNVVPRVLEDESSVLLRSFFRRRRRRRTQQNSPLRLSAILKERLKQTIICRREKS